MKYRLFILGCILLGCSQPISFAPRQEDQALLDQVTAKVGSTPLGKHRLSLSTERGTVFINGEIGSEASKNELEKIISTVPGVKMIQNMVVVVPEKGEVSFEVPSDTQNNAEIVARISEKLKSDPNLKRYSVNARLSPENVLAIDAEVPSEIAKEDLLESIRRSAPRNVTIKENVTIKKVPDEVILNKLTKHLSSLPQSEEQKITYEVKDGVVIFSGVASRHEEIDAMLAQSLMVDGVRGIESKVKVLD
jgi:osmotically-inducible protein OsmY